LGWWNWKWILGTAFASIVPGATFVLDAWLKKEEEKLVFRDGGSR
jgi:hypothetical protein